MKFNGKSIKKQKTSSYTVYREDEQYTFTIAPIPYGWIHRMTEVGLRDFPSPPYKVVKLSNGQVIKNSDGTLVYELDKDDPEYAAKTEACFRRIIALKLVEALRMDDQVAWESQAPPTKNKSDWVAYADSVCREIEESELNEDEITEILALAESLSTPPDPVEGTKDFLDQ